MKNYLVTIIDRATGAMDRIVVQSECPCGMQEYVNTLNDLKISQPMVVAIDVRSGAHLPQVDLT